jgi:uncharacterized protein YutD
MEKETVGVLYKSTEVQEKQLLLDILDNFKDSFNKKKADGFSGSFHFSIRCDGTDVEFTIRIHDSEFQILPDFKDTNPYPLRIFTSTPLSI